MRKIKFRAMKRKHKVFVYGSFINNCQTDFDSYIQEDDGNTECVDYDTVGQFTGLLDKNGKEIYEGDIITVIDHHNKGYKYEVYFSTGTAAFSLSEINPNGQVFILGEFYGHSLEVVGNIHERDAK